MVRSNTWLRIPLALFCACWIGHALALTPELVHDLALGESDARDHAIAQIIARGDATALPLLKGLHDDTVRVEQGTNRVLLIDGASAVDATTGATVSPLPADVDDVVVNNRLRREVGRAINALQLASPDRGKRLAAAKDLADDANAGVLPAIDAALAKETDPAVKESLVLTRAAIQLASDNPATRLAAVRALTDSEEATTRTLLQGVLAQTNGAYAEPDPLVRAAAAKSLHAVEARLARGEFAERVFSGVSLGSILLLAALGLAITYGLMGVINMAHGELIMIGAYATYAVQVFVRHHLPQAFDLYLVFAVPIAFLSSALVGMLLERLVIRHLYGRPLETLLTTWGLSLILIQSVRTIFGAQNVQVENPSWMTGGVALMPGIILPWSRIAIAVFAAAVLVGVSLLLTRTRLGLFVRSVTQNRAMAGALGVPTARIDMLAFGLGSGIAGLAGCALSQIGNVGPDLGQGYIVDSFMVVVLGGVGQLAGTVWAALGLGIVDKFLEAWSGAVLAKIAVLVFIILFIQKRPQGLFAFKGRAVEA